MNRRNFYSYHKYKNSRLSYRRSSRYPSFNKQRRVRHFSEAVFLNHRTVPQIKFLNKIFKNFIIWFLLPTLIIFIAGFFVLKSSYFRINQFSYEGLTSTNQDEVEEFLKSQLDTIQDSAFWPRDSYFFIDTKKLEDELNKKFPSTFNKISAHFPHTLNIQMEEKDSTIIYFNGTQYYLLDRNGSPIKTLTVMVNQNTVVTSTSSTINTSATSTDNSSIEVATGDKLGKEFAKFPLIYDKRTLEIKEGVLPSEFIKSVIKWKELVEKQKLATIKYFILENPGSGLEIFTNQPWKIFFNPDNDLFNQLNNLKLVLKENKPNEYVDLRYEGRVFWK